MAELRTALARFDDVLRQLDGVLARGRTVEANADVAGIDLVGATGQVRSDLGAALPDQIAIALDAAPLGQATIQHGQLAKLRAELARLGAVAHGVDELGGAEHVATQGGLDAIHGAAAIIQGHLLDDAQRQFGRVAAVLDDTPSFVSGKGGRNEHLLYIDAAIAAPTATMLHSAAGPVGWATDHQLVTFASRGASKVLHTQAIEGVRHQLDQALKVTRASAPAPGVDFLEANLVSEGARFFAAGRAMDGLSSIAPLGSLADDVVFDHALPALDRHIATLDAIAARIGDKSYSTAEYGRTIKVATGQLRTALADATRLDALLVDAPDRARSAAYLANNWGEFLIEKAGMWQAREQGTTMLPKTVQHFRALRDEVARILDDPQLLRAGADADEEMRALVARPGALDVAAIRHLIDGEAPLAAKRALVATVADLKPHPLDAPPAASVDEARRLLDEADVISDAVASLTTKHLDREERLLNDPDVLAAVEQVVARRISALGVADRVAEPTGNSLRQGAESFAKKLGVRESERSYDLPRPSDLTTFDRAAVAYRAELLTVTERAAVDGGLRAIAPSARPAQARAAAGEWLMRELDSLPAVAADAPAELHVDSTARRLTILADLLGSAGAIRHHGVEAGNPALMRASSEIGAIDDLWRYPDDTALRIARARRTFDSGPKAVADAITDYNGDMMTKLRSIAGELRAWSMLPDGTLPTTDMDRIAVAARRSESLRGIATLKVTAKSDGYSKVLEDWVDDIDTRLLDLDSILGARMPATQRGALDESLVALRSNLEQRAQLTASYRGSAWKLDEAAIEATRTRIDELADAVRTTHADARATTAEQLTW